MKSDNFSFYNSVQLLILPVGDVAPKLSNDLLSFPSGVCHRMPSCSSELQESLQ